MSGKSHLVSNSLRPLLSAKNQLRKLPANLRKLSKILITTWPSRLGSVIWTKSAAGILVLISSTLEKKKRKSVQKLKQEIDSFKTVLSSLTVENLTMQPSYKNSLKNQRLEKLRQLLMIQLYVKSQKHARALPMMLVRDFLMNARSLTSKKLSKSILKMNLKMLAENRLMRSKDLLMKGNLNWSA